MLLPLLCVVCCLFVCLGVRCLFFVVCCCLLLLRLWLLPVLFVVDCCHRCCCSLMVEAVCRYWLVFAVVDC